MRTALVRRSGRVAYGLFPGSQRWAASRRVSPHQRAPVRTGPGAVSGGAIPTRVRDEETAAPAHPFVRSVALLRLSEAQEALGLPMWGHDCRGRLALAVQGRSARCTPQARGLSLRLAEGERVL